MRENQLRFFEDLMLGGSEAAKEEKNKKTYETFDVSLIEREKRSVLRYLRELKFSVCKEKHLTWIINTYFERVIDLINRGHTLIYSEAKTRKATPYSPAMGALNEILSFLEVQYGKYMDMSTCLPIPHEIQLKDALVAAFLRFKETVKVCPDLLKVIETVYADFAAAKERGKTSYYRVFYLLALIKNLQKLTPATDAAIVRTLIAFNFNSPAFIEYRTPQLLENTETLALALKEINQVNVMPGLALNPLLPSAKEQLSAWLSQEIGYLENASTAPAKKITTTLSVPQFGNMLKLFTDLGVIVHPNKTELLETFASLFRTETVENISPGSLRNHFYNEDASVSRSVRDLLLDALKKLKGDA
jgi:hypothetical protein